MFGVSSRVLCSDAPINESSVGTRTGLLTWQPGGPFTYIPKHCQQRHTVADLSRSNRHVLSECRYLFVSCVCYSRALSVLAPPFFIPFKEAGISRRRTLSVSIGYLLFVSRETIQVPVAILFKSHFKVKSYYNNKWNYTVIGFSIEMKALTSPCSKELLLFIPFGASKVGFSLTTWVSVRSCPLDWEQKRVSVVADEFAESAWD